MRRVVVTGLGLVTPLGGDVETSWKNILASKSGAGPITRFDASDQKCRIACEVKPATHEYGFDPARRIDGANRGSGPGPVSGSCAGVGRVDDPLRPTGCPLSIARRASSAPMIRTRSPPASSPVPPLRSRGWSSP